MNDSLSNKRKMHLATQAVLTEHRDVWSASSPFVNNVNVFTHLLREFDAVRLKQETSLKGVTQDKDAAKGRLVEDTMLIVAGIKSYAADASDNTLYETVHFTRSGLSGARVNILLDQCKLVLETAEKVRATVIRDTRDGWNGYGLGDEHVNRLKESLTDFEELVVRPTLARNTRKEATASLLSLSAQINEHLTRKLDNHMEQYSEPFPGFYAAYKDARMIIDSGKSGTGIKGTVTDAATGMKLERVTLEIVERGATASTNGAGNYHFRRLKPGNFTLKVSAEGYEEKEMKVTITEGKTTDVEVALKSVPGF